MPKCSGKTIVKHPKIMQPMMTALKTGESISSISRRLKISRDAIRAASNLPEARQFEAGAIDALSRIIAKQFIKYEEALDSGKIAPGSIPVASGIFLDKRAGLLAEQTNKPQHDGDVPTFQSLLEELRSVRCRPVTVPVQVNVGVAVNTDPAKGAKAQSAGVEDGKAGAV